MSRRYKGRKTIALLEQNNNGVVKSIEKMSQTYVENLHHDATLKWKQT